MDRMLFIDLVMAPYFLTNVGLLPYTYIFLDFI